MGVFPTTKCDLCGNLQAGSNDSQFIFDLGWRNVRIQHPSGSDTVLDLCPTDAAKPVAVNALKSVAT